MANRFPRLTPVEIAVAIALVLVIAIALVSTLTPNPADPLVADGPAFRPRDRSDESWKKYVGGLNEKKLRDLMIETGSSVKSEEDPELIVQQAFIAEALTRFDGTKAWEQAATFYAEAIAQWEKLDQGQQRKFIRLRMMNLYQSLADCLDKLGKTDEAKKIRLMYGVKIAPGAPVEILPKPAPGGFVPPGQQLKKLPDGDLGVGFEEK